MKDRKTTLVVTPGCPAALSQEILGDDGLLPWKVHEVLLPPDSRLQYSHLLGKNHASGSRILPSPARSFFLIRHCQWLRDLLGSSKNTVVLVPKALYQATQVTLASLLILIMSGNSVTILRHHNGAPVYVQMEQVFTNLISNSVKYAPEKTVIRVIAFVDEDQIHVIVSNQGPHVPAEHLEIIFDKFFRITATDYVTGTGLGLSISKGIIEAHGGQIWAENIPDGLAFNFKLPLVWDGVPPPQMPADMETE